MNSTALRSTIAEFKRYKSLGEGVLDQIDEGELSRAPSAGVSSIATLVWHISGNLKSRFTDFLTTDGEKPWRDRESEFGERRASRSEVVEKWEDGWSALLSALDELGEEDLERVVSIRGEPLQVIEALHRSLAHTSYHVGQMAYIGRIFRGGDWEYLSIPPGGTDQYNRSMGFRP
ncbi:MAG: DUF1572 domain-containing protein [Gemmatimonadetes bacterium]|nr:DUF1572 domain-containing protein [Gemmatimonadota bacterium]